MYLSPRHFGTFDLTGNELRPRPGATLFVMGAEGSRSVMPDLARRLSAAGWSVFGGLFPQLRARGEVHTEGAIVEVVPLRGAPLVLPTLDAGAAWPPHFDLGGEARPTCLILAGATGPGLDGLLSRLYHRLGDMASYFGGGVASPDGVFAVPAGAAGAPGTPSYGAGLVALIDRPSRLARYQVGTRLCGPILATRTRGNVIEHLNWEPAATVYRELVQQHASDPVLNGALVRAMPSYPLALYHDGARDVVRAVLGETPQQGLVCRGDVPQNAVLHLLHAPCAQTARPAGGERDPGADGFQAGGWTACSAFADADALPPDDLPTWLSYGQICPTGTGAPVFTARAVVTNRLEAAPAPQRA